MVLRNLFKRGRVGPRWLLASLALVLTAGLGAFGVAHARTPVQLTFPQLPPGPWTVDQPARASGGILTLGEYGAVALRESAPNDWIGTADNNLGWWVEARARLDRSVTDDCSMQPAQLWAGDHTTVVTLALAKGAACLTYPELVTHRMDTQSAFHTYRMHVRRDHVRLWIDGRLVVDRRLSWAGGGTPALMISSHQAVSHWQYLRYDATPSLPSCTITGTRGPDRLVGGPGSDVICGGDGDDEIIGGGGDDVLLGGLGDDVLLGGHGNDTILGGAGADTLTGGWGNDRQYGGSGPDRFVALAALDGADHMSGGEGTDTVDYSARPAGAPVTITLDVHAGDGGAGENDRAGVVPWDLEGHPERNPMVDVEAAVGGAGADTLTGDNWSNTLTGGPGPDILRGLDGSDRLDGVDGAGGDTLDGGFHMDTCLADPGDTVTSCNERPCVTVFTIPPRSPSSASALLWTPSPSPIPPTSCAPWPPGSPGPSPSSGAPTGVAPAPEPGLAPTPGVAVAPGPGGRGGMTLRRR